MYKVTWIFGKSLKTVCTPKCDVAADVYVALRASGYRARLWSKSGALVK